MLPVSCNIVPGSENKNENFHSVTEELANFLFTVDEYCFIIIFLVT